MGGQPSIQLVQPHHVLLPARQHPPDASQLSLDARRASVSASAAPASSSSRLERGGGPCFFCAFPSSDWVTSAPDKQGRLQVLFVCFIRLISFLSLRRRKKKKESLVSFVYFFCRRLN
jgi:hypothetical protein